MEPLTSPIVLASGSPRRLELLSTFGLPFTVVTSGADEAIDTQLDPADMVVALAARKADAVAAALDRGIVIGADTTVAIDGTVLNKPVDDEDARRMLRLLRGRTHAVWTGVVTVDVAGGRRASAAVRSLIRMREYADAEIDAYVATGEPLDKAGAYAIQGGAGIFVEAIAGCYANVVGLPLCALAEQLRAQGVVITLTGPVCRLANGTACPRLSRSDPLLRPALK